MAVDPQKAAIRVEKLALLKALRARERARLSAEMLEHLRASEIWREARTVLIFHPLRSEPDVSPLLDSFDHQILLPRVTPQSLDLHLYKGGDSLRRSSLGTFEPDPELAPKLALEEIDLAILPGLAFDPVTRIRLGRGGGYYDRLLADECFNAITVGVAFGFQFHRGLPAEAHDQPVDHLLSEGGLV